MKPTLPKGLHIFKLTNLKSLLSFLLPILFINFAFSQQVQQPTTDEEYNYATKGYKIQFESGADMKKGYLTKDIQHNSAGERSVTLKGLFRVSEQNPCAIIVMYEKKGQDTQYFCVPTFNADAELWHKFYSSLDAISFAEDAYHIILYTLAQSQMKAFQATK
jgi:hypothetical protein